MQLSGFPSSNNGGCCDTAKRESLLDLVRQRFERFGFPLVVDRTIIPEDRSTNFICSGMQKHKSRFPSPDGSKHGSLQSCVRTNDLELVGDGSHLTYFEMLGNFSFGGNDYERSVELWDSLMRDLGVPVTHITVHPTQEGHKKLWLSRGYEVKDDESCVWSDGNIGGYCCEVFVGDLEIGNLVNPLGHSTDVGFGFERLFQVLEGKRQVHETSLFRQDLDPVVSDHLRTLLVMRENGVTPGGRGSRYVCRRLVQRVMQRVDNLPELSDWLESERLNQINRLKEGRRMWKRYKDRDEGFWWSTYGLSPEDLQELRDQQR